MASKFISGYTIKSMTRRKPAPEPKKIIFKNSSKNMKSPRLNAPGFPVSKLNTLFIHRRAVRDDRGL